MIRVLRGRSRHTIDSRPPPVWDTPGRPFLAGLWSMYEPFSSLDASADESPLSFFFDQLASGRNLKKSAWFIAYGQQDFSRMWRRPLAL